MVAIDFEFHEEGAGVGKWRWKKLTNAKRIEVQ
jgi:hypothetical protein